jgi:hypothetical protein
VGTLSRVRAAGILILISRIFQALRRLFVVKILRLFFPLGSAFEQAEPELEKLISRAGGLGISRRRHDIRRIFHVEAMRHGAGEIVFLIGDGWF